MTTTTDKIDQILQKSIRRVVSSTLNEAVVAQQKKFEQTTEFVKTTTKNEHKKLYEFYVQTFNDISAKLDTVDKSSANSTHSQLKSLKVDEANNLNGLWLHELYFSNCFDPNSEVYVDSLSYLRLQRDFGTFDDWQRDFYANAKCASSGWVICGYHTFLKKYINTIVTNNANDAMVGLYPVIVLDMHEHSMRDYGTDIDSYIIAMMKEVNWRVVEERIKKADAIGEVLK